MKVKTILYLRHKDWWDGREKQRKQHRNEFSPSQLFGGGRLHLADGEISSRLWYQRSSDKKDCTHVLQKWTDVPERTREADPVLFLCLSNWRQTWKPHDCVTVSVEPSSGNFGMNNMDELKSNINRNIKYYQLDHKGLITPSTSALS